MSWLSDRRRAREQAEEAGRPITIKIGDDTIEVPQMLAPTGIFPVPRFIRRWAGFRD
jgi:hypothetical protein